MANESTDRIWLRLTGTEPGTCRFAAGPDAVESGLCSPAFAYRNPALVEGDSLAYLTLRGPEPDATERRWESGKPAAACRRCWHGLSERCAGRLSWTVSHIATLSVGGEQVVHRPLCLWRRR